MGSGMVQQERRLGLALKLGTGPPSSNDANLRLGSSSEGSGLPQIDKLSIVRR